jgi:nucleoside-diphosphate-sugar epimerase
MDIIIQAAATTSGVKDIVSRPYVHVTDNVIMNALIFRAAFERQVGRLIFFSCTTMYQSGDAPVKETDFDANCEMVPSYFGGGWMKVYNEKMCDFYSRIGPTTYTVVRHSNVYGPHDKFDLERSHVFGATVTKVMTAPQGGAVVVWGEGTEERDLMHISDLVSFVKAALNKQTAKFALYNAGGGRSVAIKDLVQKVIALSGKELSINFDTAKPTIKTKLCLDNAKALAELGWKPAIALEEGIRSTLEWYRAHAAAGG